MEAAVITAVGIDVSKSKSTVAVRRPGGEIVLRPFDVRHTNSDLKKLTSTLKKLGGDIRIVMEHTSTYWRPIALTLKEAGFFVSGSTHHSGMHGAGWLQRPGGKRIGHDHHRL